MSMKDDRTPFKVDGPYKIPTKDNPGGRTLAYDRFNKFWVDNECRNEVGVYIFGIRGSHGHIMPWYVGMTANSFEKECFTDRNIKKYLESMAEHGQGSPVMFFLCQSNGAKTATKRIEDLEINVINEAYLVNDELKNDKGIERPRYRIEGLGEPGKNTKSLSTYLKMLS